MLLLWCPARAAVKRATGQDFTKTLLSKHSDQSTVLGVSPPQPGRNAEANVPHEDSLLPFCGRREPLQELNLGDEDEEAKCPAREVASWGSLK